MTIFRLGSCSFTILASWALRPLQICPGYQLTFGLKGELWISSQPSFSKAVTAKEPEICQEVQKREGDNMNLCIDWENEASQNKQEQQNLVQIQTALREALEEEESDMLEH